MPLWVFLGSSSLPLPYPVPLPACSPSRAWPAPRERPRGIDYSRWNSIALEGDEEGEEEEEEEEGNGEAGGEGSAAARRRAHGGAEPSPGDPFGPFGEADIDPLDLARARTRLVEAAAAQSAQPGAGPGPGAGAGAGPGAGPGAGACAVGGVSLGRELNASTAGALTLGGAAEEAGGYLWGQDRDCCYVHVIAPPVSEGGGISLARSGR